MKKIPSEFLFGQLLGSTSLGCPFTFLREVFSSIIGQPCTSQQKVDTFFIFYTLKTEHSTPYIVLVSNSLMSMQVFLH